MLSELALLPLWPGELVIVPAVVPELILVLSVVPVEPRIVVFLLSESFLFVEARIVAFRFAVVIEYL